MTEHGIRLNENKFMVSISRIYNYMIQFSPNRQKLGAREDYI